MGKFIADLIGGSTKFILGIGGNLIKSISGGVAIRNNADNADAELTASKINISGNSLVINSDAAGSSGDYAVTLFRPTSGMSANYNLILPTGLGSLNQTLTLTNATTGQLGWATVAGGDSANTPNTLVLRDANGNFAAGKITLSGGNASTNQTTGDLVVTGGIGVGGRVSADNFNGFTFSDAVFFTTSANAATLPTQKAVATYITAQSQRNDIVENATLYCEFSAKETALSSVNPSFVFTRNSTAYRVNKLGILESVAVNTIRYDYDPASLLCRGILIEESRTNLLSYSEQFDHSSWNKSYSSVITNNVLAPNGTTTAEKLIEDTTNIRHYVLKILTVTANTTYTVSVFAKAAENNFVTVIFGKNGTPFTRGGSIVNLTTGVITSYSVNAPLNVIRHAAEQFDDGWWRISVSVLFDATSTDGMVEIGTSQTSSTLSYTGSGNRGIYIWGAQLEVGEYPTSYIPTVGSSVTRSADDLSIPLSSSWYKTNQGTLGFKGYFLGNSSSSSPIYLGLTDSNKINTIALNNALSNNKITNFVYNNSSTILASSVGVDKTYGDRISGVIAFNSTGNISTASDGNVIAESINSSSLPQGLTQLLIGQAQTYQSHASFWLSELYYLPGKLSDNNLSIITS